MEELLMKKQKYLDKEESAYELFYPLLGDSLIFLKSNKIWEEKRKSLSVAFFKNKLVSMIDIIKK
jgi:hypothetical protein